MWMKFLLLTISLLFCLLVHVSGVSGGCVDMDLVKQDGKRMISNVFKIVGGVSLYTCVSHCLTVSMCKSVSYKTETRTCHLASQDSVGHPTDVHTDPEFFLTDISQWPTSLAGPCGGTTCPSGSKCVVDRLQNPSCVTDEETGCDSAPDLTNATKTSPGRYEGAVTQYTCLSDFIFCGTSSAHTCSSLGNWEGLSGSCNRSVWNNPPVRFQEPIPCEMTEYYHLVIEATPLVARRMVVNLRNPTADTVLLQLDFRFDSGDVTNQTWFNRKVNNVWDQEIAYDFPFVVGQPFVADIRRQNSRYEVLLDGVYYGGIADITPGITVEEIIIDQDLELSKVEFSHV